MQLRNRALIQSITRQIVPIVLLVPTVAIFDGDPTLHSRQCPISLVVSVPSQPFTKSPSKFAATLARHRTILHDIVRFCRRGPREPRRITDGYPTPPM